MISSLDINNVSKDLYEVPTQNFAIGLVKIKADNEIVRMIELRVKHGSIHVYIEVSYGSKEVGSVRFANIRSRSKGVNLKKDLYK